MSDNEQCELESFLTQLRKMFERMVATSLGSLRTAGTCAYASFFVDWALKRFMPQYQSRICGGDGLNNVGYLDVEGNYHGHYWVELDDGTCQWVADITADQFGGKPVTLCPLPAARQNYRPGTTSLVARDMREFMQWLEEGE